jgi:hypothetical protein
LSQNRYKLYKTTSHNILAKLLAPPFEKGGFVKKNELDWSQITIAVTKR